MFTLIATLCLLGLIVPPVSAELDIRWDNGTTFGEIVDSCVEGTPFPAECQEGLDKEAQFQACAAALVYDCHQLVGNNFTADLPVTCTLTDVGRFAASFEEGDLDAYQVTALKIKYSSGDLLACSYPPYVSFSPDLPANDPTTCVAQNSQTIDTGDDRFNPEEGLVIEQEFSSLTSISVVARAPPPPPTLSSELGPTTSPVLARAEDSCAIKEPSGALFLRKVVQGNQAGGENETPESASLLHQLGTTGIISILAAIGLATTHVF